MTPLVCETLMHHGECRWNSGPFLGLAQALAIAGIGEEPSRSLCWLFKWIQITTHKHTCQDVCEQPHGFCVSGVRKTTLESSASLPPSRCYCRSQTSGHRAFMTISFKCPSILCQGTFFFFSDEAHHISTYFWKYSNMSDHKYFVVLLI